MFEKGLATSYEDVVEKIEGVSFVSWASVLARSGRPKQEVVRFTPQGLFLEVFGGAVVAVDTWVGDVRRRCWLPVLDAKNNPVPASKMDVRSLNDTIARCRAKSVAMATGHSLSYYAGGLSSEEFVKALGDLRPDCDPATVQPFESKKVDKGGKVKASYLGWPAAIAAASITDPQFTWEVIWGQVADKATGEVLTMPYMEGPGGGYIVGVKINWRDRCHTEFLPILGIDTVQTKYGPKKMEHRPNLNPTAADWNTAVMRCLAKGIAVCTGYGLSLYAGEDLERLIGGPTEVGEAVEAAKPAAVEPAKPAATSSEGRKAEVLKLVEANLVETSTKIAPLYRHFGVQEGVELSSLSLEVLQRMLDALEAKKKRMKS